jgi:hypothetical protein
MDGFKNPCPAACADVRGTSRSAEGTAGRGLAKCLFIERAKFCEQAILKPHGLASALRIGYFVQLIFNSSQLAGDDFQRIAQIDHLPVDKIANSRHEYLLTEHLEFVVCHAGMMRAAQDTG